MPATLITTLPEYADIDSIPLCAGASAASYAWMATDLADVRAPAQIRGTDRTKPTAPGVTVTRRRKNQSRRLIPMLFTGDCESDGTAAVYTPDEQVWVNFDEFVGLVVDPPSGDPSRTLTVVHGTLTWAGDVVIEDFEYDTRGSSEIVGVLDVSIPAGRLALTVGS